MLLNIIAIQCNAPQGITAYDPKLIDAANVMAGGATVVSAAATFAGPIIAGILVAGACTVAVAAKLNDEVSLQCRGKKVWPPNARYKTMSGGQCEPIGQWYEVSDNGLAFNIYETDTVGADDLGRIAFGPADVNTISGEKTFSGKGGAVYTIFYKMYPGHYWDFTSENTDVSKIMLGRVEAPVGRRIVGVGFSTHSGLLLFQIMLDDGQKIRVDIVTANEYELRDSSMSASMLTVPEGKHLVGLNLALSTFEDGYEIENVLTPSLVVRDGNDARSNIADTLNRNAIFQIDRGYVVKKGVAQIKYPEREVRSLCLTKHNEYISFGCSELYSSITGRSFGDKLSVTFDQSLTFYDKEYGEHQNSVMAVTDKSVEYHLFNRIRQRNTYYAATTEINSYDRSFFKGDVVFSQQNGLFWIVTSLGQTAKWYFSTPLVDIADFLSANGVVEKGHYRVETA